MHFLKRRSHWIVNSYINLTIKTVWFILQSNLSAWAGRELSPVLLSDPAGNKHVHTQTLCPWGKTHHWTVAKNSKHLTSLHYWTYLSCACAQGREMGHRGVWAFKDQPGISTSFLPKFSRTWWNHVVTCSWMTFWLYLLWALYTELPCPYKRQLPEGSSSPQTWGSDCPAANRELHPLKHFSHQVEK